jgi:hypothetical protein
MHFAMLVIGTDAYNDLYRYDENFIPEGSTYTKEEIIEDQLRWVEIVKKNLEEFNKSEEAFKEARNASEGTMDFYKNDAEKIINMSEDELHKRYMENNPNMDFDDNGDALVEWNQDGRYDWYVLGGRWQGLLKLKRGATSGIVGGLSSFGGEHKNDRYDAALYGDIDWESEAMSDFSLYGWVDDYDWIDRYSEGLDSYNDDTGENLDKWKKAFSDRLSKISDDTMVYVVDFHV